MFRQRSAVQRVPLVIFYLVALIAEQVSFFADLVSTR